MPQIEAVAEAAGLSEQFERAGRSPDGSSRQEVDLQQDRRRLGESACAAMQIQRR